MKKIRGIFHIHTVFSKDASLTPEKLIQISEKRGLGFLAITDHNTLKGAWETRRLAREKELDLRIISGEEIATLDGEIIGLFLKKEIPPKLSLAETLKAIREQKGIVYLPHPFDSVRRERIRDKSLVDIYKEEFDLVEVFNSRNMRDSDNRRALETCRKYGRKPVWGADAHFSYELFKAVVEMPEFDMTPSDFLEKMKDCTPLRLKKSRMGFLESLVKKYLLFSHF